MVRMQDSEPLAWRELWRAANSASLATFKRRETWKEAAFAVAKVNKCLSFSPT